MAKLQISACGLAVHWEGQCLAQHSKALMRNWEVGIGGKERMHCALFPETPLGGAMGPLSSSRRAG